jgi:hypothetical protein
MKERNFLQARVRDLVFAFGVCALSGIAFVDNLAASPDSEEQVNIYGQFSSSDTQISNNPASVNMEAIDVISPKGLKRKANGQIQVKESGVYFLTASGQIGSIGFAPMGSVSFWLTRNGAVVPNTGVRASLPQKTIAEQVTIHAVLPLHAGDVIGVEFCADTPSLGLVASPATANQPAIPSAILSIFKVQ